MSSVIRVGVFGAAGRMGSQVCRAVVADPETELVAAIDPTSSGRDLGSLSVLGGEGIRIGSSVADMMSAGVDVAVDFTVAPSAMDNIRWCATHSVHAVVGTTGFSKDDMEEVAELFAERAAPAYSVSAAGPADAAGRAHCVIAPNFSIGAVLMMRFAEIAAAHMDAAEIIELHHDAKVDAPSGTSLSTARRIDASRRSVGKPDRGDPTVTSSLPGTRGGVTEGGVRIHAVRLPGLVAHQEVIFGGAGESLTVRHDSLDRACFMPGVLMAVKRIATMPGLTIGIESIMGL